MKKTGSILAIFLIASLFLSISVVHAQHTEPDDLGICAKVSNVDLNGQGSYLEVGTDEAYMITLDYQTWSWVDENRRQQIIIGLDDEPFWCVYDGISMAYSSSNGHGRTLTEIQKPGTYNLMWMTTFCNNPKDGLDFYKSHPELREKIGMIKVMDCGGGICNTYCEVIGINLNGQNDYLEIGPGETIKITIYYEIWNPIDCPECTQQIVIGLEDNPMYCAYNGIPGIHPGILDHDQVFYEMTAPTEPGIYNIMWMNTMGYTCDDAKNLYRGLPLLRKKVGTIKVTDDGSSEWKWIHEKKFPELPYEMTTITFYQRGNDLLVQINDSSYYGLKSGSVSISVNESVRVNYNTAYVLGLHYSPLKEDYWKIIKPEMTLDDRSILFVAGLLGGKLGRAIGIVQYAQDVTPDEIEWYAEKDCTKNIPFSPKRHFDWLGALNSRDNIIIPWYIGISHAPVKSIKVKCPKMDFTESGTYTIVFRVDYTIALVEVRYDVALPIPVT